MLVASIVSDMLSAFGCFSLTVILMALAAVLAAAKLGFAPGVARVLDRVTAGRGES